LVDLLDKNILDVIDSYKPPEKEEGPTQAGSPLVSISVTELKQRLKYNISTEALESRLKGLEEGGFLRSDDGKWRLTFKGKMLLEDFWDTLAKLKIVEEVEREIEGRIQSEREARFKEIEAVEEEVEQLPEAGATSATKMGFVRRLGMGLTETALFVFSGIFFFATGVLLLGKIYQPSGILLFGLDAWILTLAFGVVLAIITGVYISFRSPKHEDLSE